jgi:glycine C-acetyltransferase/8-amino-7-oxononanoate synthase
MDPEKLALSHNGTDFSKPVGRDLLARTSSYYRWYQARTETGTWQYSRALVSAPGPRAQLFDDKERRVSGINFASQDYLALGQHPAVHESAVAAIRDYGPHSAGSAIVIGNTASSLALERELADFLQAEHVVLFPTGWAAGYGTITGLVREYDHVVMDRLSHACLQAGVYAATRNVHRHEHLDVESAREHLRRIRAVDSRNAILVVSEGLFSMDADSPDLSRLQEACREYDATLFVDIAHDLGATGPGGTGQLGVQKLLGQVDLVMGSFSKSFASNGGFLATRSPAVKQYLKMYGNPHLFSNALSPVQTAVVRKALEIIRSPEGEGRRQALLGVVKAMREEFRRHGVACYGAPSPIIPVPIGSEAASRVAHRLLTERGIAAMIIEYPLVAIGAARFRLQAMANHTVEQGLTATRVIARTIGDAHAYLSPTSGPVAQGLT